MVRKVCDGLLDMLHPDDSLIPTFDEVQVIRYDQCCSDVEDTCSNNNDNL